MFLILIISSLYDTTLSAHWSIDNTDFSLVNWKRENKYYVTNMESHLYHIKRYFIIDQQIACHFVHYSECLYQPPSHLCNSNNQPFSWFKDLSQSRSKFGILAIRGIFILVNVSLVPRCPYLKNLLRLKSCLEIFQTLSHNDP